MKITFGKNQITAIVVDVIVLIAGLAMKPATDFMLKNMPGCPFLEKGFPCPGCGGTRFMHSMVQGDFYAAWNCHQYLFFVAIYLIALFLLMNLGYLFKIKFCGKIFSKISGLPIIILLVCGFALFGILRGLIFYLK